MFDVKKHLIKVQGGRQYLPVAARLIWFRTEHPDWGIDTHAVSIDVEKQYAIFEASVYNADGKLMAKGTKMENVRGFGDWLEKAETGAIGRALAVCGFGTQFAPDLDEAHSGNVDDVLPSSPYRNDRTTLNTNSSRGYSAGNSFTSQSHPKSEPLSLVHVDPTTPSEEEIHVDSVKNMSQGETCDSCAAVLKPSQLSLSLRKFGTALCPDCQRKRKNEQAA